MGKKDGTPLTDAKVLATDGLLPLGKETRTLAKAKGANVCMTTTYICQDKYTKTPGVKCLSLVPVKWLHKLKGEINIIINTTYFNSYDSSWKAPNDQGVLVYTDIPST